MKVLKGAFVIFVFQFVVCFSTLHSGTLEWNVESTLEKAGSNKKELEKALNILEGQKRKAACFLISRMSHSDLASVETEMIVKNVKLAFKAKQKFPWGKFLDREMFYHYVLPHRVSQEPVSNWRPLFYKKLSKKLEDVESMKEAVLRINRWCGERADFEPTQRRDQGPVITLKSGYGRCEELVIFFISACRAAGIPARNVWTPYWSHTDNNHAWAEVWTKEKGWSYVGAAEPKERLNKAWFDDTVKRASFVFAFDYGIPRDKSNLYKTIRGHSIINSTSIYTDTGELRVDVSDGKQTVKKAEVVISVFNFGALRKIAVRETDKNGRVEISAIGEGTYFLSAGKGDKKNWKTVSVKAGQKNKFDLNLTDEEDLKEFFTLTYPEPVK